MRFKDAQIIGWSALRSNLGQLYLGGRLSTAETWKDAVERNKQGFDGFVLDDKDGRRIATFAGRETPQRLNKRALFISFYEPGNYGSFLVRALGKLLFLRDRCPQFDCYVVADRTRWLCEALPLLGFPARPIYSVREVTGDIFSEIVTVNDFVSEGYFDPNTADRLAIFVKEQAGSVNTAAASIYVSRELSSIYRPWYRNMTNEGQITNYLRDQGFEIVNPETMSFQEQIRTFAGAKEVAGPSGSAMLNAIFSRSQVRVLDFESFHYTVRQHARAYASTNKRYAFLFGDVATDAKDPLHTRPWSVPLTTLSEAIEWLRS
ncbi:hypothetical protein BB934_15890 [Microvirga ossetica]|uniref:Glycosyltransferase 61 catalytic domain-containing protein n=2 Tax=Microvirga ossetica TaxID=1882682 RepID=A0A1B2EHS0_9HYPH|nr:hypothetical protein BB934_15890 [Microvirga ossetica]